MIGRKPYPRHKYPGNPISRLHANARALDSLIRRGGGLRLGTMPIEEAFEYLHHAERLVAESRRKLEENPPR